MPLGPSAVEDLTRDDAVGALAAGGDDHQPVGVAGHVDESVIIDIGLFFLPVAAVIDDAHLHGLGAGGDFLADAAKAENTDGLAGEFGEEPDIAAWPFAGAHELVGLGNAAGQGDHHADGEFGNGVVEHVGGIGDTDIGGLGGDSGRYCRRRRRSWR